MCIVVGKVPGVDTSEVGTVTLRTLTLIVPRIVAAITGSPANVDIKYVPRIAASPYLMFIRYSWFERLHPQSVSFFTSVAINENNILP
jgi:hypothetical protein